MDSLKRSWLNLTLGSKIASLMSVLVILPVFALTFLLIMRERTSFRQELVNQADFFLDTTALTMRDQIYRLELDEHRDEFELVSLGSVSIRGKDEPVEIWSVKSRK